VAKLLVELSGVVDRRARFRTVALVHWPDGREVVAEGCVEGTIATTPRGTGGFGYDPVFVADGAGGRTFAELGADAKNALSHRRRAMGALAAALTGATSL
jgi:XTP/dITP diphosphohydrolase